MRSLSWICNAKPFHIVEYRWLQLSLPASCRVSGLPTYNGGRDRDSHSEGEREIQTFCVLGPGASTQKQGQNLCIVTLVGDIEIGVGAVLYCPLFSFTMHPTHLICILLSCYTSYSLAMHPTTMHPTLNMPPTLLICILLILYPHTLTMQPTTLLCSLFTRSYRDCENHGCGRRWKGDLWWRPPTCEEKHETIVGGLCLQFKLILI